MEGKRGKVIRRLVILAVWACAIGACALLTRSCRNSPWPLGWSGAGTFYTSYVSEVKTLDPAVAYFVHESLIIDNVVESPLGYDYLKRPYELIPILAESLPEFRYFDASGRPVPEGAAERLEVSVSLKAGVRYQPHPCFALDDCGRNSNLAAAGDFSRYGAPQEFPYCGTREMTAEDFKVGLVRLCDRRLASPVFSNLSSFIAGMDECSRAVAAEVSRLEALPENAGRDVSLHPVVVDYRRIPFAGMRIVDRRHFTLVLKRKYPQVKYWLTMHFFAPVPQEALDFYGEPRVADAGFQMRTWPVGTGPFMLTECRPRERIVLEKNPAFHDMRYPSAGEAGDGAAGLLADAGKRLPLLERIVFNYERESLPVWVKFQQGYYDDSGVPADIFDTVVTTDAGGDMGVGGELEAQGVRMVKSVQATTYYVAFNMLDSQVGGMSEGQKKLRRAISIALDFHEYVKLFSNDRDVPAQSIIPRGAGISGECALDEFVDTLDASGNPCRRSLDDARRLLAEAGYPGGIGADGRPLTLYFDDTSASGFWRERYMWMRNRLSPLGIRLESRVTDSNRFRDKMSSGNWQMLMKAWVADYPDPENFLMLFYSGNGVVRNQGHGVNYTNYASPEYDRVFKQLETMADGPARLALLAQANRILQEDAPCIWAYHRRDLFLVHKWLGNYKPHTMMFSYLQYRKVDGAARRAAQQAWNKPNTLPVLAFWAVVFACGCAAILFPKNRMR